MAQCLLTLGLEALVAPGDRGRGAWGHTLLSNGLGRKEWPGGLRASGAPCFDGARAVMQHAGWNTPKACTHKRRYPVLWFTSGDTRGGRQLGVSIDVAALFGGALFSVRRPTNARIASVARPSWCQTYLAPFPTRERREIRNERSRCVSDRQRTHPLSGSNTFPPVVFVLQWRMHSCLRAAHDIHVF